ncbi:putative tRNA pseudouridine synthase Pus10 [Rhizophlyctis rosea]|nr:putative tRNA pseudouridine synthase Pus10 [Rhizophlyctis rosea]
MQLDHDKLAQTAYEKFRQENYVLGEKTFLVSTQLPAQLAIRQRSAALLVGHIVSTDLSDLTLPPAIEIKEIFKYLISDAFSDASGLEFSATSPFAISYHFEHPETTTEYEFMTKIPEADFGIKKARQKGRTIVHGASNDKIVKSVALLNYGHFSKANMCPPPAVKKMPKVVDVSLRHESVYVAGRYNKYKRGISNSPWEIDGKRLAEDSVEELMAPKIDAAFRCSGHKFSCAGREDADVLMLGHGRPFYFEMLNPKVAMLSQKEMCDIEKGINAEVGEKIGVRDLQIVTKDDTRVMKDSASTKSKSYSCLIQLAKPVTQAKLDEVSAMGEIKVDQQNPTRVPRRADLLRKKTIESLHLRFDPYSPTDSTTHIINTTKSHEPLSGTNLPTNSSTDEADSSIPEHQQIRADMKTSAGTYVKEFVHGDGGRTRPCLAELLGVESASVVALDVLEVHLEWPRKIDPELHQ